MSQSTPPPPGVVKIVLPAALVTAMVTALVTNAVTAAVSKPATPPETVTAKEIDAMRTDIRELRGDVRVILLKLGEVSDARHNARMIDEAGRK